MEYLYYFSKFNYYQVTQENIAKFISRDTNKNNVARSFLKNLIRFLVSNYKELNISQEERFELTLLEFPKITGRKEVKVIKPLSIEDIHKIEKELPRERFKLMLLLSFYCGLRFHELLSLKSSNFYWEEWSKDTTRTIKLMIKGKGNKESILYVKPDIAIRIYKYIRKNKSNPEEAIFFDLTGETKFEKIKSRNNLWNRELKKAAINAGVKENVTSHLLRHSIGSYLLNSKKWNLRKVQVYLRHKDISSTQIYTHISNEDLRKSIEETF